MALTKTNHSMNKSLFLADDDIDDRMLFEDALNEIYTGVDLVMATDGQELMEKLQQRLPLLPSVVFLDINMPRKNGFQCLQEMRERTLLQDIPVVIISTSNEERIIEKSYSEGANYYICKPNSFEKLKQAIHDVLSLDLQLRATQPSKAEFLLQY
jgi:CheY-like chemotaxis protein